MTRLLVRLTREHVQRLDETVASLRDTCDADRSMVEHEGDEDLGPGSAAKESVAIRGEWDDSAFLARLAANRGPDLVVVSDPSGQLRYVSQSAERILGINPRKEPVSHILHFVHPDDGMAVLSALGEAADHLGYHEPVEVRVRNSNDRWVDCEVNAQGIDGPGGTWSIMAIRGLSDRSVVTDRRDGLQRLVHNASLECARSRWFDADEVVEHLTRTLAGILGASVVELAWSDDKPQLENPMRIGVHWRTRGDEPWPDHHLFTKGAQFESFGLRGPAASFFTQVHKDLSIAGDVRGGAHYLEAGVDSAVEILVSPRGPEAVIRLGFSDGAAGWRGIYSEEVGQLGLIMMSTLRRCEAERRLNERARRDSLTGLLNREELYRLLSEDLDSTPEPGSVGVIYGDIDRFKNLNDRFGHAVGDEVLKDIGRVLTESIGEGDLAARFGGDEFAIVCRRLESHDQMDAVAARVSQGVSQLATTCVDIRMSLGCSTWEPGVGADELIGAADSAMYENKRRAASESG